jgi:hypothetical protein
MAKINQLMKINQTPNFTWGHAGWPVKGPGFYGPMCGCSALVSLGWSMLEKSGLPIEKTYLEKALTAIDMSYNDDGYPYGWGDYQTHIAELSEDFVLKNLTHLHQDIHSPSNLRGGCLPLGAMTLLHRISPWKKYSPHVVENHVIAIAREKGAIVNGHGAGYLHGFFGLLAVGNVGTGIGPNDPFRVVMDYHKAYINLARCHDGSFYTQPTRDNQNDDYAYSTRALPTGCWATILSIPQKALMLQGRNDKAKIDAKTKVKK